MQSRVHFRNVKPQCKGGNCYLTSFCVDRYIAKLKSLNRRMSGRRYSDNSGIQGVSLH